MTCPACAGIRLFFDEKTARRDLRRYRRWGPARSTGMLLDALLGIGIEGRTVLDIGGGVGAVHHELLDAGATVAVDAEASPAYVAASKEEALRRGHADRIQYHIGDFVEMAPGLPDADLVVLDRVLCCYPDVRALVAASVERAERAYAYVLPRDRLPNRVGIRLINLFQRIRRHPFRVYLHPPGEVASQVRARGFERRFLGRTLLWQVEVHTR